MPAVGIHSPNAALGYRFAAEEPLFLEAYLDHSIEQAVSNAIGMAVARDQIVELGAHASERSRGIMLLWARAARHLNGRADVGVAVLTAPLRSMFARLEIPIHEICDADPRRLPDGGESWGRYYEQRPRVCAGLIADALPRLAPFDDGSRAVCG